MWHSASVLGLRSCFTCRTSIRSSSAITLCLNYDYAWAFTAHILSDQLPVYFQQRRMTTVVVRCTTLIHADNHYRRSCRTLFCSTDSTYINCVLRGLFLLALAILNRYVRGNVKSWHVTEDELPPASCRVNIRDFYMSRCHTAIFSRPLTIPHEHNTEQTGLPR
jgi:hypothetical protein